MESVQAKCGINSAPHSNATPGNVTLWGTSARGSRFMHVNRRDRVQS